MLDTDWGYQLGQAFLDAAVSCGADCATRRITEWGEPPITCATGCECELVVSVLEGLRTDPTGAPCSMQRTARVQLQLLVCWPVPESNGSRDITVDAGKSRDYATLRWQILQGLLKGWRAGDMCIEGKCIGGSCTPVIASGWTPKVTEGPCKLYTLEWEFRTPI